MRCVGFLGNCWIILQTALCRIDTCYDRRVSEIKDYWYRLACVEGLGWKRLELLLGYFGSVRAVWESDSSGWLKLGVDKRIARSFTELKNREAGVKVDLGGFVYYGNKDYPVRLREIASPPVGLFYEGDLSILGNKTIAVVGTRKMSRYGAKVTRRFVAEMVGRDFVIVSGLAKGVDGVAHETCLEQGGKTIAVLAHGLGMTYPAQHEALRRRIIESGGLIISEYPSEVEPKPKKFVVRNRIVSGLSDVVLVTESPKKSGTKITVGFAAEQGKDVYVVPGPIDIFSYVGSHEIIRDGGIPVSKPEEIGI